MKVLHIGDVVGAAGGQFLMDHLPAIKREHQIDMTIVNGENSAQGNGITKHSMEQIFTAGADVITTGNHCLNGVKRFLSMKILRCFVLQTIRTAVPGTVSAPWTSGRGRRQC